MFIAEFFPIEALDAGFPHMTLSIMIARIVTFPKMT